MEVLHSLILFSIVALFTPGPNNIMLTTSGLNFGIRASLPHLLGICFGFPTMFLALGFGLGALFEAYPLVHQFIKVIGIAYLIYLAWRIANASPAQSLELPSKPLTFIQAALFQWVNPKAWAIASGAIAAYTTSNGNIVVQILLMGLVFFLTSFPSAFTWLYFGRVLKHVISQSSKQRMFNWFMAALLIISIFPVVIDMWQGQ